MIGPDKKKLYPNENIKTVCYLSNLPKRPNVEIGDYTYYSDHKNSPEKFYDNIEHHYEFLGDKLIIGKFCAIAEGVKFIMNGANHRMDGITTYPFNRINYAVRFFCRIEREKTKPMAFSVANMQNMGLLIPISMCGHKQDSVFFIRRHDKETYGYSIF